MSKKSRLLLKRRMAQANHNVDNALTSIQDLHARFEPVHPTHAKLLELCAITLLQAQSLMEKFWTVSWGDSAEKMEHFRRRPSSKETEE